MKKTLTLRETIAVASTLFGMFFGAGNLIFPVHLGQMAGSNSWPAIIGFCVTAVSIPILAVAAIGNTHSEDMLQLSSRVSGWYGVVLTVAMYLTIGPFFAIPRCATVSFTTGVAPMMSESSYRIGQLLFTLVFFALVLFFSLKPGQIVVWIGKVINPIFLAFLAILIVVAMVHPGAHISEVEPVADYQTGALFHGFIEGYGTMDAIAGLVFGIVVIRIVRDLDVKEDRAVARETLKAGVGAGALMALVYIFTIIMGAQSRGLFEVSDNGGIALTQISGHYLGSAGRLILAITISFACLKTAIGLVTSCSEMFEKMFPGKLTYRGWAVAFTLFSFAISNVGLTAIIAYAVPVLMLLYPLATVLIIMALTEKLFGGSKYVYRWVTLGAFIPAVFDFCKTLPEGIQTVMNIPALTSLGSKLFPFFDLGLGWIVPSFIGLAIGVIMMKTRGKGQGV
ncbi:MAG: branched-chain amino acid transport system II carrier protein [Clostridiales bacterium]|nr:branched-chain amino acid transport system II carrier protein [Clostridiales bacterium]